MPASVVTPAAATGGAPDGAPPLLADRLEALRRRCFVGRESELEAFREALAGSGRPCALLYFYGPGGVGKTVLLRELARTASDAGGAEGGGGGGPRRA